MLSGNYYYLSWNNEYAFKMVTWPTKPSIFSPFFSLSHFCSIHISGGGSLTRFKGFNNRQEYLDIFLGSLQVFYSLFHGHVTNLYRRPKRVPRPNRGSPVYMWPIIWCYLYWTFVHVVQHWPSSICFLF